MDLTLSCLLLFGLLYASFSLFYIFRKKSPRDQRSPPGNTGWPFVGEALEFVASGRNGTPDKFVRERMDKFSPEVFKTSLAGETVAVFCGAAGNKFLFSNENKLVGAWWPPTFDRITNAKNSTSNVILQAKKLRRVLPEFLKPEALQKHVPIMDRVALQHLERDWSGASNKQVEAFTLVKKFTFELACRLFMNVEDPNQVGSFANHFCVVSAGFFGVPINFPGTAFNRALKAADHIRYELSSILKERRRQPNEKIDMGTRDLASHLLHSADEDGKFSTEVEVADMILGILFASHDTVTTALAFVVYYLADHPDVYARVFKEQTEISNSKGPREGLDWEDVQKMKYSRCVLNEALRLQPPSPGTFRQAIKDFTYAGFKIPKGWKAFWSVYSTHKDPDYFPNPEKFDPSRFEGNGPLPFSFVPFGGGPRMCPGSEYARVEVLIFMHRLVTKFKWERLNPNEKIINEPSPIPVEGLRIQLFPYES